MPWSKARGASRYAPPNDQTWYTVTEANIVGLTCIASRSNLLWSSCSKVRMVVLQRTADYSLMTGILLRAHQSAKPHAGYLNLGYESEGFVSSCFRSSSLCPHHLIIEITDLRTFPHLTSCTNIQENYASTQLLLEA